MPRSTDQLREDALAIWHAGLNAVRSDRLLQESVTVDGHWLTIADAAPIDLREVDRIVVVGGGKAGAGMAAGLEQALGQRLMSEKHLTGWLNVPANCVRDLASIKLHAARPAGVNEPTAEGVAGTRKMLDMARSAGPRDLGICLLSGGGSALMPAPVDGVSLEDKLAITRFLSGAGANIEQLNTVRKQLSSFKGGGLARAWSGGSFHTLIISDVLGDPLDVIASGPTVANTTTAADALAVLEQFRAQEAGIAPDVIDYLRRQAEAGDALTPLSDRIANHILANNATAVDAAGMEAERRGYSHAMTAATESEGAAEEIGRHHARMAVRMRDQEGPDCLITGGEPVVELPPAGQRGRGGRNQQLVLAAVDELSKIGSGMEGICLLSGGTDGEDGPTDAAGAIADAAIVSKANELSLDMDEHLHRCDAYPYFQQAGGLLLTGPTNTNVCDLRVVVTR